MSDRKNVEPDFAAENIVFERSAAACNLPLEKLAGGFYSDPRTQFGWAFWIERAAVACAKEASQ
ncbi:hypothetical protein RYA60_18480 [Pseudomonas syringae]|nr:hypothetical protein [Pseudomonas syringae]